MRPKHTSILTQIEKDPNLTTDNIMQTKYTSIPTQIENEPNSATDMDQPFMLLRGYMHN